jgi:serine/threonine protein kinase/WD40 repeat protein
MSESTKSTASAKGRFEQVLAEILTAEEAGKKVDLGGVLRAYPDLAERLQEFFRNRDGFDRLAPHLAPTRQQPVVRPELPPGTQFAGYEIVRELGRGGMGVVYLARQRSAKRLVALKCLRKDRLEHLTPEQRLNWLTRFRTEGQAAARIAHERVVTVYEVGAHDGHPFYSMRYVEGRSLAEQLKKGPLPGRTAALVLEQVARAVQTIHEHKVLHRDLKPHNILIDARGQPFVTDFGLAKCSDADDSLTHTGEMLGSVHYISPEQAQDSGKVTEATDVYGLGATLYALLTGRPPFQGSTAADILYQVKYHEPLPPRRVNPAVDRDLNTICLRCLEKEPRQRFATAAALAEELERYREGRPILSRPVGPVSRAWRWSRRNPAFASVSVAALLLCLLAGGLYLSSAPPGEILPPVPPDDRPAAYLEDMRRVQGHLDAREIALARQRLVRWRPVAGKPDLRGWEWHYQNTRCRDDGFLSGKHRGPVTAVACAPDGRRLASADNLGGIKIWSARDDGDLHELTAKGSNVAALAWSPNSKFLAAASTGFIQVWEVGVSTPKVQTFEQAPSVIVLPIGPKTPQEQIDAMTRRWPPVLTWNPTRPMLALGDAEGKIQIWDLPSHPKKPLVLKVIKGGVQSMAWHPQGKTLALVGGESKIQFWDGGEEIADRFCTIRRSRFNPFPWYSLAWAADGKELLIATDERVIQAYDPARNTADTRCHLVYRYHAPAAAFGGGYIWSLDRKRLVVVEAQRTLHLWDATTGQEVFWGAAPGGENANPLENGVCVAWEPDGRRLALGGHDGAVQAWAVGWIRRAQRRLTLPHAASWASDSRSFIGSRPWWPAQEEQRLGPAAIRVPGLVEPPGKAREIVQQKPQPLIVIYDPITGEVVRTLLSGEPNAPAPEVLAESPDGQWLAWATSAGLQVMRTGAKVEPRVLEKPGQPFGPAAGLGETGALLLVWSADSKLLAFTTPQQKTIRIYDPAARVLMQTLEAHGKPLRSLAWNPKQNHVAAVDLDGKIKVWEVSRGTELFQDLFSRPNAFFPLSWSPDGKLAVAGEDGNVQVWDVYAKEKVAYLPGHPAAPGRLPEGTCGVAWSPDGKRLVMANPDGTFLLWETATWKELLTLRRPPAGPSPLFQVPDAGGRLAWSPDGRQLAFFHSGDVTIWDGTPQE